jgi:hypothetical protein
LETFCPNPNLKPVPLPALNPNSKKKPGKEIKPEAEVSKSVFAEYGKPEGPSFFKRTLDVFKPRLLPEKAQPKEQAKKDLGIEKKWTEKDLRTDLKAHGMSDKEADAYIKKAKEKGKL